MISLIPGGITPLQSLLGAVGAGGGLYLLGWIATKVLKKEAMGFGDVKLLAGFGALMGFTGAVETLIVAAVLGLLVMLPYGMITAKKANKNDVENSEESGQIPFGPFLAVAAPFMYLWGDVLIVLYLTHILEQ